MQMIMRIYDILLANDGHAVIAGTSPHMNPIDFAEIKRLIGDSVVVATKSDSGREKYNVLGVEMSESLIGNKNIFFKLDTSVENAKRLMGAEVWPNAMMTQ